MAWLELLAQETGTPTTIVGAFIAIAVAMATGTGWVIRHLLTVTIPEDRKSFREALDAVVKSNTEAGERAKVNVDRMVADSVRRHEAIVKDLETLADCFRALHATNIENQRILRSIYAIANHRTRMVDAIESAGDALWTKTLDGIVTSWNSACERILGWKSQEVIGRSAKLIIPGHLHGEEEELLRKIKAGAEAETFETQRLHKEGHVVNLSVTVSPVKEHGTGRVVGVSTIAREV